MTRNLQAVGIILAGLFIIYLNPLVARQTVNKGQNYSPQEVQKVLKAIAQMKREQFRPDKDVLKKVTVTESELNSYFAYRIEVQKEEVTRELQLKLFPKNRIEGRIAVNLEGQKLPKFLKPQMTFYFSGNLKVKNQKVRLEIKDLFLEGQRIQPMVLDLIIFIASKIENTEASSIDDWYDLPYGIKNIVTEKGRAIFYY